jgi:hypothetical protein
MAPGNHFEVAQSFANTSNAKATCNPPAAKPAHAGWSQVASQSQWLAEEPPAKNFRSNWSWAPIEGVA